MTEKKEIKKIARAFIVDDDKDTLAVVSQQFKTLNVDVTGVSDSTLAVKEFLENTKLGGSFDLVAVDIRMPNLNGYELAKQIRNTGYDGLIIGWTASTTGEGRGVSRESGIDYYFSKTSINKELISALLTQNDEVAGDFEDADSDKDDQ